MADPLERLTNLVALLLEARQPLTLEQIADALAGQYPDAKTARRGAFERDKAMLREGGVPIESKVLSGDAAGATGYYIDRARYELRLDLTPEETRALQMAVAAVHLRPDWSADALLKLGAVTDGEGADGDGGSGPGSGPGASAALSALASLPVLFEAATARAVVRFRYNDRDREVEPYGLVTRDGFWYLAGLDRSRGERRTFRVDRIEGDVVVGAAGAFTVPDGFDLTHAVADDPKAIGAPQEARVEVAPVRAAKVVRELGEVAVTERRADGSVVVRVPCGNLPAFRSWVLGLLDDAVVVGPPEVRADIVAWLHALAGGGA
jgi:predicted DNA-binding transcriptional regulator YafY